MTTIGGDPDDRVFVPTGRDPVTGEPCDWEWLPRETAALWDSSQWRPKP